ncbi:MAG: hypothetical protein HFJ09_14700 [Lachnospiraceae bacterium]|nr:hypothetical protein [Lachnospiraceae bacterium]
MQKTKKIKNYVIRVICFICLFMLPMTTLNAASSLKLKYDGKTVTYKKSTAKFIVNGTEVSLGNAKGLIIDNVAMGYYKAIFEKGLGATCVLDNNKKKLTISKFDKKVELTLGSKTAYVNGKKKTLDTAPRKITYVKADISRILVPVRFVAENLGYSYTWTNSNATGAIKCNWIEYEKDGKIYKYTGSKVNCSYNGKNISFGSMPGMIVSGSAVLNAKKVFSTTMGLSYAYSSKNNTLTLKNDSIKVVFTMNSNKVLVNGKEDKVSVAPFRLKNCANGTTYTMIPAKYTAEIFGYEYNWNNKTVTSEIYQKGTVDGLTVAADASICFTLPKALSSGAVKNSDKYWNKKFTVTINGDYRDYLKKHPISIRNKVVTKYAVALNSSGNTQITFTTSKLQGYKINIKDNIIWIDVGNPKNIYKNIVVLDCGHGGYDSGAVGGTAKEKELTYKILYTYAKSYFNKDSSNVKAYWTRHDDTFVSLNDRAAYAKNIGADLFVSLHMNSASASAKGTEVFYSLSNNSKLKNGLNSQTMASMFLKSMVSVMGTTNRGVKTAKYVVIHKNTVPAVLIELGFISNSSERAKLTNTSYQKNAAKKIYETTEEIFKKYPTGR